MFLTRIAILFTRKLKIKTNYDIYLYQVSANPTFFIIFIYLEEAEDEPAQDESYKCNCTCPPPGKPRIPHDFGQPG